MGRVLDEQFELDILIIPLHSITKTYQCHMDEETRKQNYGGWKKAVKATRVFK